MMLRAGCLALMLALSAAPGAVAAPLTVTVDNIRNDRGNIRLSVFASAAEWPEHSSADHDQVKPAHAGSVVFTFDLPPGMYALAGFHDENANGRFDTDFIGIPEEGYTLSNNIRPFLSAPGFDKVKFILLPQGGAMTMHMRY
jgi:uncharacterized protein (DUF2141 family)